MYLGTTPEFVDCDVFRTKIFLNGTENGTVNGTVKVDVKLSETERRVFECIKGDNNITVNQIINRIGKGRSTVMRAIKELKTQGVIVRVGSDKTGFWQIKR